MIGVLPRIKINHKLADEISIQKTKFHYANETCSELAFFKNGEWVLEVIPEFKGYELDRLNNDYKEGEDEDNLKFTLVYKLVPNELIEKFLEKYYIEKIGECCDHIYESYCPCCIGECDKCKINHLQFASEISTV